MAKIRIHDAIYLFVILGMGLFLTIWAVITYFAILVNIRYLPAAFVGMTSAGLFVFLIILLIRYLILLWASFNQHRESLAFNQKMADHSFTPSVSILVPSYNEGPNIEGSIQSLLEVDYPRLEIVVINDGSKDDTLARAQKWAGVYRNAEVRVIDTVQNVGKAAALNLGIASSTGEILVCVDSDSRLDPGSILAGVAHFINPEVQAVAGNVKVVNRNSFLTKLQALEYLLGLNLVRRSQGYYQCVNIIPGPMGFFRRTAMEEIGGYASDTFAEDCDLTVQMLARGMRINYEPDAISWTEAPEAMVGLITQRYRWTRGILQALKKNAFSLFHIRRSGSINSIMLWYMLFEAIAWPIMNIFGSLFFIFVAAWYGAVQMMVLWWLILVLLDVITALHAVSLEEEDVSLVLYSLPYRMIYIFAIDVTKVLSTLEELFGIGMTWGQIERRGRITENRSA